MSYPPTFLRRLRISDRERFYLRSHRQLVATLRELLCTSAGSPLLLSRVVEEGRVLVDRDGTWAQRRDEKRAIRTRGERAYRREMAEAWQGRSSS